MAGPAASGKLIPLQLVVADRTPTTMSLRGRESTTKTSLNSADVDPSALLADSDPERDPDAGDEELTEEGAKKGEDKDAQDRALLTTVGLMMVFGLTNNIFRVLQVRTNWIGLRGCRVGASQRECWYCGELAMLR